jgi:hypothetical protein
MILAITARPDVGMIYLAEGEVVPQTDIAVPGDRVSFVQQRGFWGGGTGVAVLESGRVDFTGACDSGNDNCLHLGEVRPCSADESVHKTWVASVAASFHPDYTGVAPQAQVYDACHSVSTPQDTIDALAWAVTQWPSAGVLSAGAYWDGLMHYFDKAYDYYARGNSYTVVTAAGNTPSCAPNYSIGSPGNGWNVLTVGGINDNGTTYWGDDSMWDGSCWKNPTQYSDREKPEVVAPAVSITAIGLGGNWSTYSGTSLAAPQVAGLAALLMDRNFDLGNWPEAIHAIIMASAIQDVTDVAGASTDYKDGAGRIDAALADTAASNGRYIQEQNCTDPCWWGIGPIGTSSFPIPGPGLNTYFQALKGERVRVAIFWWSKITSCPNQDNCSDVLGMDLDLQVYRPNGQVCVGCSSLSFSNNYELVDFVALESGQYRINIQRDSGTDTYNFLGIAWVKDATYLPDVRAQIDSWNSEIAIRNEGNIYNRTVYVQLYNTDGTPQGAWRTAGLNPGATWFYDPSQYVTNWSGSAIVSAGEDVSVAVITRKGTPAWAHSYTGVVQAGASSPIQAGTEHYLPILYRHATWAYYSTITVQNVSPNTANVTVAFRTQSGSLQVDPPPSYTISAGGSRRINLQQDFSWSNFFGTAVITSDVPVAVVVESQRITAPPSNIAMDYNLSNSFPVGTEIYLPYLMKNYSGWNSCFVVQNTTGGTAHVDQHYYRDNGGYVELLNSITLGPWAAQTVCQSGISGIDGGSAAILSSDQPIAVVVNQSTSSQVMSYTGLGMGGGSVVLPYAYRNYTGGGDTLNSGIRIQNVGSDPTTITVLFFNQAGGDPVADYYSE